MLVNSSFVRGKRQISSEVSRCLAYLNQEGRQVIVIDGKSTTANVSGLCKCITVCMLVDYIV